MTHVAHPPETLEGWYALHQVLRINAANGVDYAETVSAVTAGVASLGDAAGAGWSALAELTAGSGDFLAVHFRETFDHLAAVRAAMRQDEAFAGLDEAFSMVGVTEAGLYHATAQAARAAADRGGSVGDEAYRAELDTKRTAELASAHVQRRLYPPLPDDMPYVCFYPMSKRRNHGQNWYALDLDERSRLMRTHGETGRRYAGRIQQVITGSIGFSDWEWGVTLFAKDPLDFKKIVTDMRFDEVSAQYAEFGPFFVGKMAGPSAP